MLVQIDPRSTVPIYKQLKTLLIAGILSGELQEGDRLSSVRDLASDLGINLHTVRKVYGILADEGYVTVSRNQGAIVSAPPALDSEGMAQFEGVLLPIIIELRARNISKQQYDDLMDKLWEDSMEMGASDE